MPHGLDEPSFKIFCCLWAKVLYFVNLRKNICIPEKITFLWRCIAYNVLLSSNNKSGIDFDLLLAQQKRKVTQQIKELNFSYSCFNMQLKALPRNIKKSLNKERLKTKLKYINKFNWLSNKQRVLRQKMKFSKNETQRIKNRKDKKRYRKRKVEKKRMLEINNANLTVLNKSKVNINNDDKRLLALGLNFVPTPCWTKKIETTEWLNLLHHIRRIEWSYVFNDGNHNKVLLAEKLKVTKFSRPRIEDLDKKTIAYTQMITSKLRNLKEKVIDIFKKHNNRNAVLNKSFKKLKKLVRNNDIIVCKTDKDGKLVIIDLATYNNIMKRELEQFQELNILQSDFEKKSASVRKNVKILLLHYTKNK